jgi:ABC-type multidrug transport system fused ATPase/permease subunit
MLKKILNILAKKQYNYLLILFIGSLIATFLELISLGSVPFFVMSVFNRDILIKNFSFFLDLNFLYSLSDNKIILIASLVLAIAFIFKKFHLFLMNCIQARVFKSLRISLANKMFNLYINVPYKFHLNKNPTELLKIINFDTSRASSLVLSLITLFREILVLLTIFTLLFYVDYKVSLLVFSVLFTFASIFYFLTKKKLSLGGEKIQFFLGKVMKTITEAFGAIKEIKILNKEIFIETLFKKNFEKMESYNAVNYVISSSPRLFLEITSIFIFIIIILIFIYTEKSLTLLLPVLSLLGISTIRLLPVFNSISMNLSQIKALMPSLDLVNNELDYFKLISKDSANKDLKEELSFNKSINFNKVFFQYPGSDKLTISDLNLKIKSGSKIGIIGKSGSGKSTFVDLLLGLLEPKTGEILVDNKNISKNLYQWRNLIGYVPQEIYLLDDTIKNNIALGVLENEFNYNLLEQAIKLSELSDLIKDLPLGIDTEVGNRGVRLSGGQKQRLGIARALYKNPAVLILDESTNSLDLENERKIINNIMLLDVRKTIIIISHRHEIIKNLDNIFIFDKGVLLSQGNYIDLNSKYNFNEFQSI